MNKLLLSRTVWAVVMMFVVGGFTAIIPVLPANVGTSLQGVLGLLAIYFKLNPSQQY